MKTPEQKGLLGISSSPRISGITTRHRHANTMLKCSRRPSKRVTAAPLEQFIGRELCRGLDDAELYQEQRIAQMALTATSIAKSFPRDSREHYFKATN